MPPRHAQVATPRSSASPDPSAVLSKAVVRAASFLELTQKEVAGILGLSEASVSRLFAGAYLLQPGRGKEWELGVLLVRLYKSLDALWGHGEEARTWLASPNLALSTRRPRELLTRVEGLVDVIAYLDAARGRV
jgi:hypothetical protein